MFKEKTFFQSGQLPRRDFRHLKPVGSTLETILTHVFRGAVKQWNSGS